MVWLNDSVVQLLNEATKKPRWVSRLFGSWKSFSDSAFLIGENQPESVDDSWYVSKYGQNHVDQEVFRGAHLEECSDWGQ